VRRIIGTMIGLCVGIVALYFPSAYVACDLFWPASNLCGLLAMMIAAPIGSPLSSDRYCAAMTRYLT